MTKIKICVITIILVVFVISVEIYLRYYWGFCDIILIQEDPDFEYIAQPNQTRFRFRHHVKYNEYSMRSEPLKKTDKIRILGFGDSVINGGALTDQDSIATTIIEKELTKKYGDDIRCLNISAGSWGPDNCYAYLEKYGDFDAELIFLVVSSHDAHDNMTFEKSVDVHPGAPSKQAFSAIYELFNRYLLPWKVTSKSITKEYQGPIVKGNEFNTGFSSFFQYTKSKDIPFFIYLHPDKLEVVNQKYDYQGDKIIQFCSENDIPLVQGILFENESMFRDGIHPNKYGQKIMAKALLAEIEKLLVIPGKNME